ncbi:MAG TPA: hypothetical protein ENF28_05460 [Proteobacteria bacterium]|nr:hypothetical protein [Pseudomonadota bacterium]
MEKLIQQLEKARELYREVETASRLLGETPIEEWSQGGKLQRFQDHRQQVFTALEKVNAGISAMNQQFPSAADMPAELQALIKEQLELIELIQQHDQKLLARGQAIKQQLAPLLKNINTYRKLFKEYQPEDKNPPPPRFFKATV